MFSGSVFPCRKISCISTARRSNYEAISVNRQGPLHTINPHLPFHDFPFSRRFPQIAVKKLLIFTFLLQFVKRRIRIKSTLIILEIAKQHKFPNN
jgi:hypothetical protein